MKKTTTFAASFIGTLAILYTCAWLLQGGTAIDSVSGSYDEASLHRFLSRFQRMGTLTSGPCEFDLR